MPACRAPARARTVLTMLRPLAPTKLAKPRGNGRRPLNGPPPGQQRSSRARASAMLFREADPCPDRGSLRARMNPAGGACRVAHGWGFHARQARDARRTLPAVLSAANCGRRDRRGGATNTTRCALRPPLDGAGHPTGLLAKRRTPASPSPTCLTIKERSSASRACGSPTSGRRPHQHGLFFAGRGSSMSGMS